MSHLQNMRVSSGTSEITESTDELILAHHPKCLKLANIKTKMDETVRKKPDCPVEDDLNRLLEAFDLRSSSRASGPSRSVSVDLLRKSAMKKPVRIGLSQASGIGISESVTLKQALRRLCITQASEMAATKRISKPVGLSGASEAGAIKRLYAAVVVEASESGKGGKGNLLEISLVPEKSASMSSEKITESSKIHSEECLNKTAPSTSNVPVAAPEKPVKTKVRDIISPASPKVSRKPSPGPESGAKGKLKSESSVSSTNTCNNPSKLSVSPHLTKPAFKNYSFPKKKGKGESTCTSGSCGTCHEPNTDSVVSSKNKPSHKKSVVPSGSNNAASLPKEDSGATKPDFSPGNHSDGRDIGKTRKEILRSKDKGECSQSSKSSIGDYSSSTSISDESNQSNCSVIGSRPHMSNDVRWAAIHDVEMQYGNIGLKNFKLLKRLGCGDIGSVYLAELTGSECMFALKVMDNEFLINRKKMMRAQTEREILQMLDHPFLPTLYTFFTTDNLSCLVMEYCPGGDLHVLRQKQQGRNFSEPAARFYVAEVLLALEYLHMLGVVYRDLKPENILVREDGHIMLSDFDLSLRCSVNPMLLRPSSVGAVEAPRPSGACAGSSCIDPLCLHPSWVQTSCFTPRLLSSAAAKNRRPKWDGSAQIRSLPQLVVEPTEARSNSFVGTHEYLAPEIIKGEGHGSSVDWWTFGIFLYELLYGRTPFKGPTNEDTLANVISQSLKFPDNPAVSFRARDLIRGLLVKEPEKRLGSVRGAAEIKRHPFFEGLNWALIRCAAPPETPKPCDFGTPAVLVPKQKENKCTELRDNEDDGEFEIF